MASSYVFALINIIGGTLVLSSYMACIYMYPEYRESFWGGVQGNARRFFVLSMIPSALGYIAFFYCVLFKLESWIFDYKSLLGNSYINILCIIFLSTSSIWMPALVMYFKTDSIFWWLVVVGVLWVTALSLILMLFLVISIESQGSLHRIISICGLSYIIFHCSILDAIIWVSQLPVRWRTGPSSIERT